MSANSKKTISKGKRYTDAEKQEVVSFAHKVNAASGRGGQAAAARKFGISVLTVSAWLKARAATKTTAPAKVAKATKAVKVAKVAKAVKVVVSQVKKGKKKSPQGKRYSDEQKQTVLDFVIAVNTRKGRGGLSAATKKFRISPLTISSWLRKSGLKMAKPALGVKAAKTAQAAPVKSGLSAAAMIALGGQIAKAENELAKLKVMLRTVK
jgi:hypothetical protein